MNDHLHPDQLAAIALDPEIAEDGDHTHLDGCPRCRREIELLRDVSARARRARPDEPSPAPPESVWDNVVRELADAGDLRSAPAEDVAAGRRPRPRWWVPATVAAVLVALAVLAAVAVLPLGGGDGDVVAEVILEPLSSVQGASAVLSGREDALVLTLETDELPPVDGYYELWLLTPDGQRLVSLGPVEGSADVAVPAAIDTAEYSVVDISREPADGDPAHSTDSVLRGPLQPTT